jgi:hypothetical protein
MDGFPVGAVVTLLAFLLAPIAAFSCPVQRVVRHRRIAGPWKHEWAFPNASLLLQDLPGVDVCMRCGMHQLWRRGGG